ncbi:MAG: bifunctional oligoribonuclease/PAP phosphatase NrnA [Actinomycetota bacterium]|jgi:phosphoesterase RecJ-like protein|nr:bifunctional oligoribonuclease/PAP phosphatase NrnA [Actinomycetota bacterium]
MLENELDRAAVAISQASSVALACHVCPDGDALGSMLALHHLCASEGKPSTASWSEPFEVAPHYRFLPGLDLATKPADFPAAPDVMITFDCGSMGRLGDLGRNAAAAGTLIVIDHHATNDRFGAINVIDPDAAATAVLVRRLADRLGWTLTKDAATCLYTGLVTDTGRFQYANTTPEVFALAHELSTFELPIAELTRQLFEEHRFEYLKLVGDCIGRAQLDRELRFVATWVTFDDLHAHGCDVEETEGLIDLVRRASEAEVSCVVKETPEGLRVSLRAIADTDVSAIATRFGGGGHRYAAGFVAQGRIDDVLAAIKAELHIQRQTAPQLG